MASRFGISRPSLCISAFCLLLILTAGGCTDNYASSGSDQPGGDVDGQLPQHLPDAELKMPDWVGKDADEPFDVKGFLESRAAPADNAAPLYFAALAEISTEMYFPEPSPGWPWKESNIPERVGELGNAVGDMCDNEKLLAGEFPLPEVEAVLEKAKPAVEKLDAAQKKPDCIFINGLRIESLLPHIQAARAFGRLATIQLYHARETGDFDEAEKPVRRTLRFSRDLRKRGVMVTQMVAWTIDGIVLSAIKDFTLTQKGLTPQDCDRLLTLLTKHEQEMIPSFQESVKTEYVTIRNTLDDFQQGRIPPEKFVQLAALWGELKPADIEKRLGKVNWPAEIAALNAAFAEVLAAADIPGHQAVKSPFKGKLDPILKSPNLFLASAFMPVFSAILNADVRYQTRLAGMQCLVAVRRYELEHGKPPADLAATTSEAGLKEVPIDPYSGKPMRYKVIDGKPVVYSVGKDGKDDGGEIDWEYGKKPGDFIFRIRE